MIRKIAIVCPNMNDNIETTPLMKNEANKISCALHTWCDVQDCHQRLRLLWYWLNPDHKGALSYPSHPYPKWTTYDIHEILMAKLDIIAPLGPT